MNNRRKYRTTVFRMLALSVGLVLFAGLRAQVAYEQIRQDIRKDIYHLADDSMKGRKSGTEDEAAAARYIADEFHKAGLKPAGEEPGSYFQSFAVADFSYTTIRLTINDQQMQRGVAFGAVAGSGNGRVQFSGFRETTISGKAGPEMKDQAVLLDMQNSKNLQQLEEKIYELAGSGATSILLYNAGQTLFENVLFNADSMPACPLPVLYLTRDAVKILREQSPLQAELSVKIGRERNHSSNVIGLLDSGSDRTVVIGAHYDHVGYKLNGNDTLVFNGADDNASGTAGVLELARLLGKEKNLSCNYLFIAFSSEEAGLLGSKHFCNSGLMDRQKISWMLNMDMIGRLAWNGKNRLTVMGVATSKTWPALFRRLPVQGMRLVRIKGAPPYSDHFPFLEKKIPLIYFTTGLHKNYHKISDDASLINFEGEADIIRYLHQLILEMDKGPEPEFHRVNGGQQFMAFIRLFLFR